MQLATRKGYEYVDVALREVGVKEVSGPEAEARILEYHSTCSLHAKSDEVAWCSAFVNWVMAQVGGARTKSAAALSWLKWGEAIKTPCFGCLVILDYGGGHGHVGIVVGASAGNLVVLGGNQSNQVCLRRMPKKENMSFRKPSGALRFELPEIPANEVASLTSIAETR